MQSSANSIFGEEFLRRLERLAIVFRASTNSRLAGERRSVRRGNSVEFTDFRPYSLGDDFRRVDWNAYARLERLFIKLFVAEEDAMLSLLIDNSPSMNWGEPNKLQVASRLGAALGYIALVGLDRVSAATLGKVTKPAQNYLPPIRGKQNTVTLFSFISGIQACQGIISPYKELATFVKKRGARNLIVVLSDLLGEGWETGLNALRSHQHEVFVIHILAPEEISPDLNGDFRLVDAETNNEIELTADYETLQHYRTQLKTWQQAWKEYCFARGILYLPISSAVSLEDLLFSLLPKQGMLK